MILIRKHREAIGEEIVYRLISNFFPVFTLNPTDDTNDGSGDGHEMSYTDSTTINSHTMSHNNQAASHAHDLHCLTREHDYHYQHRSSDNDGNGSSQDGNMQHQMNNSNNNNVHNKSSQSNSTEKKYLSQTNGLNQNNSPSQVQNLSHTMNYNINQADPRSALSSGNSGNSGDVPTCTGGANSTGIDSTYSTGEDGQHPMSLLHPNSHALAHSILNDSSAQAAHRHLHQHHMTNEGETSYRFH